jgi:hypothetical protein
VIKRKIKLVIKISFYLEKIIFKVKLKKMVINNQNYLKQKLHVAISTKIS